MERWQNKVAVVTGASVGIGAAIVKDLLSNGLQVVGLARRLEVLKESKQKVPLELQKNYTVLKCDVGDAKCVDQVFDKIVNQLGGVDILVNCAAVMKSGSSLLIDDVCTNQEVLQTNVMGVIHCTKRAFQSMKERNFDGHVILLNSIVGHNIPCLPAITPLLASYIASKYAITAITETYRQEFMHLKTKIKITSISPGVTDTEMISELVRTACGNNFLKVEDVSSAVMFAISTPPHVQIHEIVIKPVAEVIP